VGQSIRLAGRFRQHKINLRAGDCHCARLQRAWNRDGADAFVFEVLEDCEAADLTAREQAWMDYYAGLPAGIYNTAPAAGSTRGLKVTLPPRTPEHNARLAEARKGNTNCVGRALSEETKAKLRKPRTAAQRARMSAAWTAERKAALAARNRSNPPQWSDEARTRASASHTGMKKPLTPEGRARVVAANKRRAGLVALERDTEQD
jgi:group I intron endonuclease